MEEKKQAHWLFRKFFTALEIILIAVCCTALYLYYTTSAGSAFLLIIGLSSLAACYAIKAFDADASLGLKPRIVYFCCSIPCVALMFSMLVWPGHSLMLIAGLACMAIGWGVFLWSRTRQRDEKNSNNRSALQASSYMMFFRLLIYTVACLVLLLDRGLTV